MSLFQASANRIILDANKQAVFEIGDKYVVAYCTKVTEAGPAPFKDVESDVRFSVLKDKKADIISSELKNLETNGKTLDQIAVEVGVQVQEATQVNFRSYSIPGAGIEPALIAAATVAEQGAVSGPVKGNNGVFLLTVNNITTPANDDLKLVQERLASTFEMRGAYEAYDALVKSAKVIDKRYKFY
jgi:peptidyl-prolyl cis-trans isomerase D